MQTKPIPIPTLPTTSVNATPTPPQQRPYAPGQRLTADQYFRAYGTTGSPSVNYARAADDQAAALSKARRKKALMEQATSVRHYRLPADAGSAEVYLKQNPPHPNPPALTSTTPQPPTNMPVYRGGDASAPTAPHGPAPDAVIIDMRGKNGNTRLKLSNFKKPTPPAPDTPVIPGASTYPTVADEMPATATAEEVPTFAGVTPDTETADTVAPQVSIPEASSSMPQPREKKPLFARFRKQSPSSTSDSAATPTFDFSEAAYVAEATPASTGAPSPAAADAMPEPTPQPRANNGGWFSGFKKKQQPVITTPEVVTPEPAEVAATTAPTPTASPNNLIGRFRTPRTEPAAPQNIFRPMSSAQSADSMSKIRGQEVYATVDGEQVKLGEGTMVKVLKTGTDRSLIRLYDNRQATIDNSALVPAE